MSRTILERIGHVLSILDACKEKFKILSEL